MRAANTNLSTGNTGVDFPNTGTRAANTSHTAGNTDIVLGKTGSQIRNTNHSMANTGVTLRKTGCGSEKPHLTRGSRAAVAHRLPFVCMSDPFGHTFGKQRRGTAREVSKIEFPVRHEPDRVCPIVGPMGNLQIRPVRSICFGSGGAVAAGR